MATVRTRSGTAALVLGGLLLAGGCSDGNDDASGEVTSTTAAPAATTSTAPPSSTTAATTAPAEARLSAQGYGSLVLGQTLEKAKSDGLVTNVRPGCEFAGPGQVSADVTGKPDVFVIFDDGKLTSITVHEGATAEGLPTGATIDQAKQTYSTGGWSVVLDESTVEVFDFITVRVQRNGADVYSFSADAKTKKIDQLAAPHLALCD